MAAALLLLPPADFQPLSVRENTLNQIKNKPIILNAQKQLQNITQAQTSSVLLVCSGFLLRFFRWFLRFSRSSVQKYLYLFTIPSGMQSSAHLMMLLVWSQQVQHLPLVGHHLLQHLLLILLLAQQQLLCGRFLK
jgi:hypothetical protein